MAKLKHEKSRLFFLLLLILCFFQCTQTKKIIKFYDPTGKYDYDTAFGKNFQDALKEALARDSLKSIFDKKVSQFN
jgi:hypothetical protein